MAVCDVIRKFQEILRADVGKRLSYGADGVANLTFLTALSLKQDLLQQFLREVGLIKNHLNCPKCGTEMKLKPEKVKSDGYVWICRRSVGSGKICGVTRSIREASWFKLSKLTLENVLLLTYHIVRRTPSTVILSELGYSEHTVVDWRQFVREKMTDFIESNSEKIGGPGKIVEIDESKFGKRKYNKGHKVDGQWVFGGVERGSGRMFLVAVHDRTQETLLGVLEQWVEKGTLIHSDGWAAYKCLKDKGYDHLVVNHSETFVDPVTKCHTNTIESTWRHVKSKLPSHNRQGKFEYYLGQYMFEKSCAFKKEDPFNAFVKLIGETDWNNFEMCVTETKNRKRKLDDGASTSNV